MAKIDDSSLTPEQLKAVRAQAEKALLDAEAFGCYPTPVADVMQAAKISVSPEDALDEDFLSRLRSGLTGAKSVLKRALSKVLGVLDARDRVAYIDRTVAAVKQTFLKLHETAHAILPWQRKLYVLVEDCEKTLDPEISDLFDREANVFASEVLFQLDTFEKEASDYSFEILTPVKLSKKYGGSLYSTIRRYVSTNARCCAVMVLNPPEAVEGDGFIASRRRTIASSSFAKQFGNMEWPEHVTPDCSFGRFVPLGKRRMSRPSEVILQDANGVSHEFVAEGFTSTRQIFILICHVESLTKTTIVIP